MARRILLLTNKFPYPETDGGSIATMSMIRGFHRAELDVTVLAMNTFKHNVNLRDLPESVRELGTFYAVDTDIQIKLPQLFFNLLFSGQPYHMERFDSPHFRSELSRLLRRENFDLIQLEGLFLSPYIEQLREEEPQTPIVLRAHNIEHEIWQRQAEQASQGLRRYYLQVTAERLQRFEQMRFADNSFDAVVPITARDAKLIKSLGYTGPVHVANAGYDFAEIDASTMKVPVEYPSVFYIGAMDWTPNQEAVRWFLRRVWPKLHALYPDVRFYLAGRRMPTEFQNLDDPNVVSLGEVPDAEAFIRSKGIMVAPLFAGSGMRVKLIEGMALEKAIVATNIAAEGISARHGHHLMLADTVDDFVDCVGTLIEQPSLGQVLGENAHAYVRERFDNQQLIERLLQFYEQTFWQES